MQQNQLNHCRNELRSCQARLILKNGKYFRFLAKPWPNLCPKNVQNQNSLGLCVQSANQDGFNTQTTAIKNDINVTTANSQSTNYSAPIVNQNERISSPIGPDAFILFTQNTSILSLQASMKHQSVYFSVKTALNHLKVLFDKDHTTSKWSEPRASSWLQLSNDHVFIDGIDYPIIHR